jgi:predicted naringenin-chalcone synthase
MVEAVAAAVAAALISTGSAAALAAARKAGETRDAVLVLTSKLEALDNRVAGYLLDVHDQSTRIQRVEHQVISIDSRVTALEAGVVDRRRVLRSPEP